MTIQFSEIMTDDRSISIFENGLLAALIGQKWVKSAPNRPGLTGGWTVKAKARAISVVIEISYV